jgi:hypothetical protein
MKYLILTLLLVAGLTGCTTEQANNWAALAAVSAKAGWDAGGEIAEARREADDARAARILEIQQQFQPSSATIMAPVGQRTLPYASQNLAPSYIYFH